MSDIADIALDTKFLHDLYDRSFMAAAAVTTEGRIVYSNPVFSQLNEKIVSEVCGAASDTPTEKLIFSGPSSYHMFVTPYEGISVVTLSPCGSLFDDYIPMLSAAVRDTLNKVTNASDRIDENFNSGDIMTALLNSIDSSLMALLSEFIIPEHIFALRSSKPEDFPVVSVSEGARRFAEELSGIISSQPVAMSTTISPGMFARVDLKALILVFAGFIVSCMEAEFYMDAISVRLERTGESSMTFTVSCSNITKKPQTLVSYSLSKKLPFQPEEELARLIEEKFDCRIKHFVGEGYMNTSAEIPMAESPFGSSVKNSKGMFFGYSRFSETNIMLSRFRLNPRYKFKSTDERNILKDEKDT